MRTWCAGKDEYTDVEREKKMKEEFQKQLQTQQLEYSRREAAQNAELEAQERKIKLLEAMLAAQQERDAKAADNTAAEKLRDAIHALDTAEAAIGNATIGEVRELLYAAPEKETAVAALTKIEAVARYCDLEAYDVVRAAVRAVRDVAVLRCRSRAHPGDRDWFLENAAEAFGKPLDTELKSLLLLSYHKMAKGKQDTFISNAQLATARRGRPPPRPQRNFPDAPKAEAEAARVGVLPTIPDDGEEEAAAEPSEDEAGAWKAEPAYVSFPQVVEHNSDAKPSTDEQPVEDQWGTYWVWTASPVDASWYVNGPWQAVANSWNWM